MTQDDHRINLASRRLGAEVLAANDEFFAAKERLIDEAEPVFDPDRYVSTGKWMDGWETRRRREPGDDWCLLRLGCRGSVEEVVVDTTHFRGNFPEHASLEGCDLPGQPDLEALEAADWLELVPKSPLRGDTHNVFSAAGGGPLTHLRLRIFPDGGVARLRAYGRVAPDWDRLELSAELVDLAAIENGGRVTGATDVFFAPATNLLLPGRASYMGEGWETRRRRGPGHDAVTVRLGAPGEILRAEIDTLHFKGNAPGSCTVEVADAPGAEASELEEASLWRTLLPEAPLRPHARCLFEEELADGGRATHAHLKIFPDGGVSRFRLWGRTERSQGLLLGVGKTSALPDDERRAGLLRCCGSTRWAERMAEAWPPSCAAALMRTADRIWWSLEERDWLEAFAAHPKIGEKKASGWSSDEQAGARSAEEQTLAALAEKNRAYEERFGFIYIVCASGKSADEMLALLEDRLQNDPDREIRIAAEEQRKITRLRLERWLGE